MIKIQNLSIGYKSNILLENVDLTLSEGNLIALLGRNGTGKSSLLRTICGLDNPLSGTICLNGQNIRLLKSQELAKIISMVTTERVRIANLRCKDVVALGRAPHTNWVGQLHQKDIAIVNHSLKLVGMENYADRTMNQMSDGECQRIMIARALAQDTSFILLDEPTSFLDLPNRYELCSLLQKLAHQENKCILFSTHELDIALTMCDSIALIDKPQLYHLSTKEMIASGHIERLFSNSSVSFDAKNCSVKRNMN